MVSNSYEEINCWCYPTHGFGVFIEQLKLLQQRNQTLREMYSIDFGSMRISVLEEMVTQSLMDLDWQRDRSERWIHHLSTDGFMFEEVVDNKRWKQIGHDLRVSYKIQSI